MFNPPSPHTVAPVPVQAGTWLTQEAQAQGLHLRGCVPVNADTGLPALPGHVQSVLVLVGTVGSAFWPSFSASPEYIDGLANPLDRWSQRLGDAWAGHLKGKAWYPFGGPPHLPFQRWADACEALQPSPLGLRLHPGYGLWHAYRLALQLPVSSLPDGLTPEAVPTAMAASLCTQCVNQPCLSACPVNAFSTQGYDVPACLAHLQSGAPANACTSHSCQARLACPVGVAFQYTKAHGSFHMQQFLSAHETR